MRRADVLHQQPARRAVRPRYCSAQRVSGTCDGTYRTRQPVEAAVALWLQQYAEQLEKATRDALAEQPVQARQDPHQAERRKLVKVAETAEGKFARLLDDYTDGALDLPTWKQRREAVEREAQQARTRMAELDAEPEQAPSAATISTFADTWPTLSVDARRDVAGALLLRVQVNPDKTVKLLPRWGEPVTVTFNKRGRLPVLTQAAEFGVVQDALQRP